MRRETPEPGGAVRRWRTAPARTVIFLIELYRNMVSPLRLPSCRFTPTCSQYAVEALREYGLIRGSWLTVVRLAKCAPWHPGGWDPIPEPDSRDVTDSDNGDHRWSAAQRSEGGAVV